MTTQIRRFAAVAPLLAVAALLPACAAFDLGTLLAPTETPTETPASAAFARSTDPGSGDAPTTQDALAQESRASLAYVAGATRPKGGYAVATASTKSNTCGATGQRPCLIWERIPSCDAGLVENLLAHRCEAPGAQGALASNARAVTDDLGDLLVTLGGYISCFDAGQLDKAIHSADARYAKQLENSSCMKKMGAIAASRGYQTVTVGISGGGSFVVGAFVDTGFAFDTAGRHAPTLYQTKAISIGFQAGAGVGVNIGLYRGSSAVDTRGSDTQGFTFEAGAGAGAGTGVWYDYDGKLDGVSVSAIAGAEGQAGAYNRINTAYYDPAGDNPMVCGGVDQRACKVWERIPSCDKGLYENLLQGMCRKPAPPKKLACGAKHQRPCKLWERIPSCDKGLVEDFFAGQCK